MQVCVITCFKHLVKIEFSILPYMRKIEPHHTLNMSQKTQEGFVFR